MDAWQQLFHLLKNSDFKDHALACSNGSSVIHLSKKTLPSYIFKCPPISRINEFTERVIKLKGLKTSSDEIIPLQDLSSIIHFLANKYEIFQITKKSDKAVYLGKLIELQEKELLIDFLGTEGKFEGEMSFKLNKIRVIEFDTDYINSLKLIVDEENKK